MFIPLVVEIGDNLLTVQKRALQIADATGTDVVFRFNQRRYCIRPSPGRRDINWQQHGDCELAIVEGWTVAVGPCADGATFGWGVRAVGRVGSESCTRCATADEAKSKALDWVEANKGASC